jgi:protein TIF31
VNVTRLHFLTRDFVLIPKDSYTDYESRAQLVRIRDLLHISHRHASDQAVASADLSNGEITFDGLKADSTDALRDNALLASYFTASGEQVKCVRSLNYSGFNPPPANRRLMGDFYYIDFVPLDTDLASVVVCANTRGFYVTQSKQGRFNPTAASKPCHATTLSACLSLYSAKFKKTFEEALEQHHRQASQEYGAVAFPPNAWVGKTPKAHEFDLGRSEQDLMRFTETAVTAVMQGRDWNEELQAAREMSKNSLPERIARDRQIYRAHSEYVEAATQAAVSIFNGQIQPLNSSDNPSTWIYVHNNIFFTQATDMRGVYADCGGDETFEKSVSNDLVSLKRFHDSDPSDLYTLDNVLIRYCGKTLFAQTIIPGLFNGLVAGETPVVYGSLEGQGVAANADVHSKIAKVANFLHLKEHKVLNNAPATTPNEQEGQTSTSNTEPVTLWTSADVKGIVGTDNRTYLLDLGHLFARDGNFADDKYPNAVYRPELVTAYASRKWYLARTAAITEMKLKVVKDKKDAEAKGEKFEFPADLNLPDIPMPVISLNPDLYVKNVKLADSEESVAADTQLNTYIARFLTDECIPMLVNDWAASHSPLPIDTQTLTSALHARGINLRYLGRITTLAIQVVPAIRDVLYREMIVRASQSVFRRLVQKVPSYSMGEFVISFLNAFFDKVSTAGKGSRSGVKPAHMTDAQATASVHSRDDEFGLSHHSLWVSIRQAVESKFSYTLPEFIPSGVFELAVLRAICLRLGVRLEAKNYDFNKDAPFELSNLIEMLPVVKHVATTSRDGHQIISAARSLLAEGNEETGAEVLQEALSLYHQSFGPMYREIGTTFSTLALLAFQNSDVEQAVQYMERSVFIFEKTLGPDHHDTIHSYGNLATMVAAAGDHAVALNYLRRALYLGVLVAGWNHPENASTYINIAIVMHDLKQYKESLPVLNKAQKIVDQIILQGQKEASKPEVELAINGANYALSAGISHLFAIAHAGMNNFRAALDLERKNYDLLKQMQVAEDDPRITEANLWLHELTRRAVDAEKSGRPQADVTSRLGGRKGVNTKVLKSVLGKTGSVPVQMPSESAPSSIKRPSRMPNSVIGKGTSAAASSSAASSSSSSSSSFAAASSSAPSPKTKGAKASGKKSASTAKQNGSAPVPDLI